MKSICFLRSGWLLLFLVISLRGIGQSALPAEFLGNWANTETGGWEYGFYEDGAIVDADFWTYKRVEKGKKPEVVLVNGGRERVLRLKAGKKGTLTITRDDGRKAVLKPCSGKEFVAWEGTDTVSFGKPLVKEDTVTIRGYMRNLDKVKHPRLNHYTFMISYQPLLDDEFQIDRTAKIDSTGRFTIRFAVCAPQQVFLDWGRMSKSIVVEPGETIMIYADALDMVPRPHATPQERFNGGKDILFMGGNARLHDEYTHFPFPVMMRSLDELIRSAHSDVELLREAEADYQAAMAVFDSICRQYPRVSKRCREAVTVGLKYKFAGMLMQYQFHLRGKNRAFSPAYMDYVDTHFSLDEPLSYFLTSDYELFLRDYANYMDLQKYTYVEGVGLMYMPEPVVYGVLRQLKAEGMLPDITLQDIDEYEKVDRQVHAQMRLTGSETDTIRAIMHGHEEVYTKVHNCCSLPEVVEALGMLSMQTDLMLYDTLVTDELMRQVCYARKFVSKMELERMPLSPKMAVLMRERISNPLLRQKVEEKSEACHRIAMRAFKHEASLKNAKPFEGITDADSLWQALVAPYKGSVILLDIWGTWCSPCKRMFPLMKPVKQALEGTNVVFMYFAYASEEETWKNVIREFDLTGENIVHYNLPPEQQQMIIDKLQVQGYPTYKIIDRQGKVTGRELGFPLQPEQVIREINEELGR